MKWLKWEGRGEYAWSHLNLLCSRAVPNREFLFVCEPPLTFKSLSHPLCSGCRMIRLRAERWRRRWEEAGIKAIVWRGWIVAGVDPKARSPQGSSTLLCSTHGTWQGSFVQASGEFHTKISSGWKFTHLAFP